LSIDDQTFVDCYGIKSVFYKDTITDWDEITIYDKGNSKFINATRYYYSETTPTEEGNFWHYVDEVPTIWTLE